MSQLDSEQCRHSTHSKFSTGLNFPLSRDIAHYENFSPECPSKCSLEPERAYQEVGWGTKSVNNNGNVLNRTSMDINLFNKSLSDEILIFVPLREEKNLGMIWSSRENSKRDYMGGRRISNRQEEISIHGGSIRYIPIVNVVNKENSFYLLHRLSFFVEICAALSRNTPGAFSFRHATITVTVAGRVPAQGCLLWDTRD
ncbi:hypothetical protein FRACYDRAFT_246822 [Fragilariopsis cylindrus CCMP1102]|uniref:Uncharacterized protein n=1 Tax=Fragilariopsis cylindrus CCMP1102 TaxID=635003 RepID=A0A1E7EYK4_9STRA|nr:hypothetical protein FRACYDRAFT_246822 [Fragilariopsis cylindrus CCMP1102]|eukprot:OEU10947.1 hypothetical protein FRACYDRAFT_246822 [Fragilariopsis cylindrus CCMP1102]